MQIAKELLDVERRLRRAANKRKNQALDLIPTRDWVRCSEVSAERAFLLQAADALTRIRRAAETTERTGQHLNVLAIHRTA